MGFLSNYLTELLLRKGIIEESKKPIYKYGFEIIFSSIISILLILVAGLIFNVFLESIIFLAVIIPLRQYTGGYHANSYLVCNIGFIAIFLIIVFSYKMGQTNNYFENLYIPILIFSETIIFILSPIENENKKLTEIKKVRFKKISIILSLLICLIIILLLLFNNILYSFITLILLVTSIMMLIPFLERRVKNEE